MSVEGCDGDAGAGARPALRVHTSSPPLARSASAENLEAAAAAGTEATGGDGGRAAGSRTPPPRRKRRTKRRRLPPATPTLRLTGSYHEMLFGSRASDKLRRAQQGTPRGRHPVATGTAYGNSAAPAAPAAAAAAAGYGTVDRDEPSAGVGGNAAGSSKPRLSMCGIAASAGLGFPINVGWAVGEALIIPRLLELGASKSVASLVFLIDPVFGLVLQPLFGVLSDRCTSRFGRRRPFIFAFTVTVCAGLALVMYGVQLANTLVPHAPLAVTVAIMFCGYGTMDLSADLLVVPSRSLLVDLAHTSQMQRAVAWWASLSSLGRFTGLAIATVPFQYYDPFRILGWDHLRSVFSLALVLFLAYNWTVIALHTERRRGTARSQKEQDNAPLLPYVWHAGATTALPYRHPARTSRVATASRSEEEGEDDDDDDEDDEDVDGAGLWESLLRIFNMPRDVLLVFLAQSAGWLAFMAQSFYWTSWVPTVAFAALPGDEAFNEGVRWGTLTMAIQSLVSFLVGYTLEYLNHRLGTRPVFYFALLLFMAATLCIALPPFQTKWGALAVALICGPLPAVQGDNPYILVEEAVDEADRAAYVSILNLSMVVCQIATSLGAALVLAATHSLTVTIVSFVVAATVLALSVMVYERLVLKRAWT